MSQDPMQPAGPANTGAEGGEPVPQPAPVPRPPTTPGPPGMPHLARTSGLAAASLVLGILGFLSCGLTGFVGLVLGIVALVGISRSAGRLRGQGIAVAVNVGLLVLFDSRNAISSRSTGRPMGNTGRTSPCSFPASGEAESPKVQHLPPREQVASDGHQDAHLVLVS